MSKKKVLFVMTSVGAVILSRFSRICDAAVVFLTYTPSCFFIAGNKDLPLSDTHLECAFVKCGVAE